MLVSIFKKRTLQKKIFIICILISLIPLCVLGLLYMIHTKNTLSSRERIVLTDTLKQENLALDSKLNSYEDAINYICWHEPLRQAMSSTYESNYEMFLFYRDTLRPLMSTVKALYGDINNIVLYTDLDIYSDAGTLQPISLIEQQPWFEKVSSSSVLVVVESEEKRFSLVYQIYGVERNNVILKMDIDYDSFFASFVSLYEDYYRLSVTDKSGMLIYQYATPDMQEYITAGEVPQASTRELLEEQITNNYTDWEITIARPTDVVYAPISSFLAIFYIAMSFCTICIIGLGLYMSRSIVQPLIKLQKSMRKIEGGNFRVEVNVDSNDEIGQLANDFNHMAKQIDYLINEVFAVKIQQQEQEMLALQAQINPHFLYNSLSLINSKAILSNQKEIAQMAQYLSTFYRTSLNRGKSIISVREELENIRSYIDIQLLLHSRSFRVEFEIDEKIYQYTMQKLLLQPLVENAILHGLDHARNKEKLLSISGFLLGDTLVFRVADNGSGIIPHELENILSKDAKGYGIKNIHQRIQIMYGSQYGLSYQSVINEGTVVTLTLPQILK